MRNVTLSFDKSDGTGKKTTIEPYIAKVDVISSPRSLESICSINYMCVSANASRYSINPTF